MRAHRSLAIGVGISLLTACLGIAGVVASPAAPDTISPAWQKVWPSIVSRSKPGPTFAPDDVASWAQMRAENEKALLGFAQTIVSSYGVTTEDAKVGDVPVVWITPKAWRDDGRILIYVHGGGFVAFSAHSTLYQSALMAARSGIRVLAVDYTTAPAARWPQITDQMIAVYRAVLAAGHEPSQIGMWGDSAGGSIVAGATLKLRDQGLPMPAALVLWSPWSDVSMSGDSYTTLGQSDPLLDLPGLKASGAAYADPADQKNPYVSPVYGDYSKGFPPTLIQGGTHEMFLSNCVRQYQALVQAGIPATLDLYEGMVHVFQPMAPATPEGRAALTATVRFWNDHLHTEAVAKPR